MVQCDTQQHSPATPSEPDLCRELDGICAERRLNAVFQPIIDIRNISVAGHEGLIRGPSDSALHSPVNLFKVARQCDRILEVEYLCRRMVLQEFSTLGGQGKIFLNVSPDVLLKQCARSGETLRYIEEIGLKPEQVIIEITENTPTVDYSLLREAAHHYRNAGFEIAMDDLGEGFSGLRLWSELRPDYVKIDQHFIQGINSDPVKLQFVRSIQEIARKSGSRVIAEGIETEAELSVVRDLGITYGQGYFIARPAPQLLRALPSLVHAQLSITTTGPSPRKGHMPVEKLLRQVTPVTPQCQNDKVYEMFEASPGLHSIPVVNNGQPVGLIGRYTMIDNFARPFRRELYGKKSCMPFMDNNPLVVEKSVGLHELSDLILQSEPYHLAVGFIITDNGQYAGMGSGHDLLRLITQMQIDAARYANPLTLLPGNVPINEHIDSLLDARLPFTTCYFDLDHFKPFNDVYGYQKGDEVIQNTGSLLKAHCHPHLDFIGHIGGDDFIVLFQSEDWEQRCQTILDEFGRYAPKLYSKTDVERGGIVTEDRRGKKVKHGILSLSVGAVIVEGGQFHSYHEISTAAAVAKKQAKKIPGNSLFVERRAASGAQENSPAEQELVPA